VLSVRRYLLRSPNQKLRQGAVGAFALTRGLAAAEEAAAPQIEAGTLSVETIASCGLILGEVRDVLTQLFLLS
jgi:hypothetical protein